jgi:hypothetical protein
MMSSLYFGIGLATFSLTTEWLRQYVNTKYNEYSIQDRTAIYKKLFIAQFIFILLFYPYIMIAFITYVAFIMVPFNCIHFYCEAWNKPLANSQLPYNNDLV